jgi:hypothetical protein
MQALKANSKPCHFQMAKGILLNVEAHDSYLRRWIFSDEPMFYILGRADGRYCRLWGSENPQTILEIERVSPEVNARCVLTYSEVLGPFLFVEYKVTAITYLEMLQLYLLPPVGTS